MDEYDWNALADEYGPYAVLVALFAFMFWIRARSEVVSRVIKPDTVLFSSGNDPWYHARIVHLTVEHFPATPVFDPWSYFPYGTGRHSGFGGLFDQLIALVALVIGGGSPSEHLVDVVIAYAPAVFGAATVVPAYLIARRFTGRWAGLIAAGLLALASGQFLSRTIVGSADHQSAEAFFGTLAVLGFLYAVRTAYAEQPTTADIRDRNWIVLGRPVTASLVGGAAIASYLMMWPPGVMIVFTLGIFVVLQAVRDHLRGRSLEYLAFGVVLAMLVAALLPLLYAKSYRLAATSFSLLQPLVPAGIGAGTLALFGVSEYARREGYERRYYPVAVAGLIVGAIAVAAIVYPRSIDLLGNLLSRVYSFGLLTSSSQLTVAEIQPADLQDAWRAFGPVFYIAILGLILLLVRVVNDDRPTELLVLLWSITIFSAYFTMIRFGYYAAVNVALLAGFAIWWIGHRLLRLDTDVEAPSDLEAYQIIGVIVILIAVVPGNVVAIQDRSPVWETSTRFGGTDSAWHEELEWMEANTPEEPMAYDELYAPPEDGDFDYPPGAYGVMSWWDYGHWITFQAKRIPNANPFQQGPRPASAYLQAASEERANLILEALPSLDDRGKDLDGLSNEELRSIVADQTEQEAGEDTRYVVIDDQMAAGKFPAIATWTGPASEDGTSFSSAYYSTQEFEVGGETAQLPGMSQRYRQTMLARLYFGDASGLSHYRLVHETEQQTTFVSVARQTPGGFQSTGFIHRRLSSQVFSAVQGRSDLHFYGVERQSRVKTFERVEGARLTGTVEASNETPVFAVLRLRTNTGRNVTYVQQARTDGDGAFSITVPYATDDAVPVAEGGTDSGVAAAGDYTVTVGNPFAPSATGNAEVPESAVYEGRTIEVELSEVERPSGNETGGANASNATGGGSSALPPPSGTDTGIGTDERVGAGPSGTGVGAIHAPPVERYRAVHP